MSPRHVPASAAELQRVGLFGSLSGETIAKLAGRMVREQFPAGSAIVTEGEHTDRFYVLLSGLATVTQEGRGTRAVMRPGETFGEVAPLMQMERTATVTAMTACVVASCDRATFDELLRPLYVSRLKLAVRTASESAGQATFAHSPNSLVVSATQAMPRSGSTQMNVPLPPKWPNVRGEVSEPDQ